MNSAIINYRWGIIALDLHSHNPLVLGLYILI